MNWDALGAIAELLGAVAVFVTLVYLALQIRQNTKAVRASAMHASVTHVAELRRDVYSDAEMTDIYIRGNADPESLNPVEQTRYRTLVHNMMMSQVNTFAQVRYADLPESSWTSQAPIIQRVLGNAGGRWFWQGFSHEFDEHFREEIDEILRRTD